MDHALKHAPRVKPPRTSRKRLLLPRRRIMGFSAWSTPRMTFSNNSRPSRSSAFFFHLFSRRRSPRPGSSDLLLLFFYATASTCRRRSGPSGAAPRAAPLLRQRRAPLIVSPDGRARRPRRAGCAGSHRRSSIHSRARGSWRSAVPLLCAAPLVMGSPPVCRLGAAPGAPCFGWRRVQGVREAHPGRSMSGAGAPRRQFALTLSLRLPKRFTEGGRSATGADGAVAPALAGA